MITFNKTPRTTGAASSVFVDPEYYAISIRIGYQSSAEAATFSERLDRQFGSKIIDRIFDWSNVSLSIRDKAKITEIAIIEALSRWKREPLAVLPAGLKPVFVEPNADFGDDMRAKDDERLIVNWDHATAQLALRSPSQAAARDWFLLADNLAVGLGLNGVFCEWRLTNFHDDPEATWRHLGQ